MSQRLIDFLSPARRLGGRRRPGGVPDADLGDPGGADRPGDPRGAGRGAGARAIATGWSRRPWSGSCWSWPGPTWRSTVGIPWSLPAFAAGFGIVLAVLRVNHRYRHASPTLRRVVDFSQHRADGLAGGGHPGRRQRRRLQVRRPGDRPDPRPGVQPLVADDQPAPVARPAGDVHRLLRQLGAVGPPARPGPAAARPLPGGQPVEGPGRLPRPVHRPQGVRGAGQAGARRGRLARATGSWSTYGEGDGRPPRRARDPRPVRGAGRAGSSRGPTGSSRPSTARTW